MSYGAFIRGFVDLNACFAAFGSKDVAIVSAARPFLLTNPINCDDDALGRLKC